MKITKAKSEELVFFLTKSKKEQVSELELSLSKKVKQLYDKSLPKEIVEAQKKYPDYFQLTNYTYLYGCGLNGHRFKISEPSIHRLNNSSSIDINGVQGEEIFKLFNELKDAKDELNSIKAELLNIILMLGTKLKVLKEFPEAESCFKDSNSKCTDVSVCVSDIRKKIFSK